MKSTPLTQAAQEVVDLKMEIVDELVKDFIDEIGDIGSPEKLLGKIYADWTPQDLELLANVYGNGDNTPLAKLIFAKEYKKVLDLEQQAGITSVSVQ